MSRFVAIVCLLFLFAGTTSGQQVADTVNIPAVATPNYQFGEGPLVAIDAAHNNFHTADDRFMPFATVLRRDGYHVIGSDRPFTDSLLATIDILVISNPLHPSNVDNWALPTPSAFTDPEIDAVATWITKGGRLFLIADHMPFPGAAMALGKALGVTWNNGFAIHPTDRGFPVFRRSDSTLRPHATTEDIDSVVTFTGSTFSIDQRYTPLLIFADSFFTLMPEIAWQFTDSTAREPIAGWPQVAVGEIGKGRVVVSGEAAMFTAQLAGEEQYRIGMNAPFAPDNAPFLLNLMHWLSEN